VSYSQCLDLQNGWRYSPHFLVYPINDLSSMTVCTNYFQQETQKPKWSFSKTLKDIRFIGHFTSYQYMLLNINFIINVWPNSYFLYQLSPPQVWVHLYSFRVCSSSYGESISSTCIYNDIAAASNETYMPSHYTIVRKTFDTKSLKHPLLEPYSLPLLDHEWSSMDHHIKSQGTKQISLSLFSAY
jgi:hypothetical protein